jgi:hypothetical protein
MQSTRTPAFDIFVFWRGPQPRFCSSQEISTATVLYNTYCVVAAWSLELLADGPSPTHAFLDFPRHRRGTATFTRKALTQRNTPPARIPCLQLLHCTGTPTPVSL